VPHWWRTEPQDRCQTHQKQCLINGFVHLPFEVGLDAGPIFFISPPFEGSRPSQSCHNRGPSGMRVVDRARGSLHIAMIPKADGRSAVWIEIATRRGLAVAWLPAVKHLNWVPSIRWPPARGAGPIRVPSGRAVRVPSAWPHSQSGSHPYASRSDNEPQLLAEMTPRRNDIRTLTR